MSAGRAILTAAVPTDGSWLTSTVGCSLDPRGDQRPAGAIAADLRAAIVARLPLARFDVRHELAFGLDLRLDDPADQDERDDAFAALDGAALAAGLDARLLSILDWIQGPARRGLPRVEWYWGPDRQARQASWEARYAAVSALRAPLLGPLLGDPRRHAIKAPVELAAVHGGLPPCEAYLVRRIVRDTPKTRPGLAYLQLDNAPYEPAVLMAGIATLEADGWLSVPPSTASYHNSVAVTRGSRAQRLSADDLLID